MGPRPLVSRGSAGGAQPYGSAKELIGLYEENYKNQQAIPTTPPLSFSLKKPPSPRRKKDKSPIRQSLSKVISLFKKGNSTRQFRHAAPLQSTQSEEARLAGSLLYLSQYESTMLAWTPCTAAIENGTIHISPQTDSSPLSIQLKHCSDVRSLSVHEISEDEMAVLPDAGEAGEFRVFELVFDGATEKFAVSSIRERASWVSTIWDAILLMQESKSVYRSETSESLQSFRAEPVTTLSRVNLSKPLPLPVEERSLPSLPLPSDSDSSSVNFSPFSRSMPPEVSHNFPENPLPPSLPPIIAHSLSVPPTSPLRSTSIANLSKRSVVKQRLAQMERDYSETSVASSSSSSPRSPRRNRPLPSPYSLKDQPTKSINEMYDMQPTNTGDSIVDSYCHSQPDNSVPRAHWSRPAVSPIAEDSRSDASHTAIPLRVDTRDEILHPDRIECNLPQAYQDTGDLIAAQEVQNSKQMVSLNEIRHSILNVDSRVCNTGHTLLSIDQKLDALRNHIDSTAESSPPNSSSVSVQDVDGIHKSLDALRAHLSCNVIDAIKRLEEVCKSQITSKPTTNYESAVGTSNEQAQLTDALALLREHNDKDSQRDQLQADSVRYLNELNVWLETFVNGGTSQIQVLSTSIQQVIHSLGASATQEGGQGSGLLNDIKRLAQEGQTHNQNTAALHASLNNIIDHFNVQGDAPGQPTSNTQAIAEIIERQRQDHEGLMRMLANELSSEIKGERLRFVEAMKEATAINIQGHIEQFKKELKREVVIATKEIGRLHQDKQNIESQIADLFAFYSKQANNGTPPPALQQPFSNQQSRYGGLRTPEPSPERRRRY